MPGPDQPRTASPWVITEGPAGDPGTPQLFCFAHAGGGPSFFRPWRTALAPGIAVCPVALPGREARLDEQPFRRITELVEPLGAALLPHLDADRPYALFGHSMGAVAAYEVARWLTSHARTGPACLLVSGRRAPSAAPIRQRISELPDGQFLAAVRQLNGIPPEVLREPELLSMLLPALRADFELAETYQPLPGGGLGCPVAAYLGTSDPEVTPAGVLDWQQVTTAEFSVRVFRGDHFYLKGDRPDVLSAVREDLHRSRLASPARAPATAR